MSQRLHRTAHAQPPHTAAPDLSVLSQLSGLVNMPLVGRREQLIMSEFGLDKAFDSQPLPARSKLGSLTDKQYAHYREKSAALEEIFETKTKYRGAPHPEGTSTLILLARLSYWHHARSSSGDSTFLKIADMYMAHAVSNIMQGAFDHNVKKLFDVAAIPRPASWNDPAQAQQYDKDLLFFAASHEMLRGSRLLEWKDQASRRGLRLLRTNETVLQANPQYAARIIAEWCRDTVELLLGRTIEGLNMLATIERRDKAARAADTIDLSLEPGLSFIGNVIARDELCAQMRGYLTKSFQIYRDTEAAEDQAWIRVLNGFEKFIRADFSGARDEIIFGLRSVTDPARREVVAAFCSKIGNIASHYNKAELPEHAEDCHVICHDINAQLFGEKSMEVAKALLEAGQHFRARSNVGDYFLRQMLGQPFQGVIIAQYIFEALDYFEEAAELYKANPEPLDSRQRYDYESSRAEAARLRILIAENRIADPRNARSDQSQS